jgi:hypothetical protein
LAITTLRIQNNGHLDPHNVLSRGPESIVWISGLASTLHLQTGNLLELRIKGHPQGGKTLGSDPPTDLHFHPNPGEAGMGAQVKLQAL